MKDLIHETIETYNEYLKKVPNGTIYIATSLREDNEKDALQAIKDFSEGVIWLAEASELLNKNGATANLTIQRVHDFLMEINEGLEKQDYLLVADLFEYEITPFFESIEEAKGAVM